MIQTITGGLRIRYDENSDDSDGLINPLLYLIQFLVYLEIPAAAQTIAILYGQANQDMSLIVALAVCLVNWPLLIISFCLNKGGDFDREA